MSVRKRTWMSNGAQREAWIVEYRGTDGRTHIKTFAKKRDADAYHAGVGVDVRSGLHVADSQSPTLGKWRRSLLDHCANAGSNAPRWLTTASTWSCTCCRCWGGTCGCRN